MPTRIWSALSRSLPPDLFVPEIKVRFTNAAKIQCFYPLTLCTIKMYLLNYLLVGDIAKLVNIPFMIAAINTYSPKTQQIECLP